jgi:hypothetical protein
MSKPVQTPHPSSWWPAPRRQGPSQLSLGRSSPLPRLPRPQPPRCTTSCRRLAVVTQWRFRPSVAVTQCQHRDMTPSVSLLLVVRTASRSNHPYWLVPSRQLCPQQLLTVLRLSLDSPNSEDTFVSRSKFQFPGRGERAIYSVDASELAGDIMLQTARASWLDVTDWTTMALQLRLPPSEQRLGGCQALTCLRAWRRTPRSRWELVWHRTSCPPVTFKLAHTRPHGLFAANTRAVHTRHVHTGAQGRLKGLHPHASK